MTRAEQLALAAKWALGVDANCEATYMPHSARVRYHDSIGLRFIPNVTPTEWQNAILAALISIAETARESDAVAGRIFDAANGSVTDSAGKIATVPNPRLPQPAVHLVPACVPEEIREELGRAPMVRTRLPLAQPASIYGETNEEVRP